MRLHNLLLVLPLFATGCFEEEIGVSLFYSYSDVSVAVEQKTLVATLEGAFTINFKLGVRASQASDVSFGSFSLVREGEGPPVIEREHLSVVTGVSAPLHLEPGDEASLKFIIGFQDHPGAAVTPMEVSTSDYATVCAAGKLRIQGMVEDSANGNRPVPALSPEFLPGGCAQ